MSNWWQSTFVLSTFTSIQEGDDVESIISLLHELGLNAAECNAPLEYRASDPTKAEIIRALKACGKYGLRFFVTDHERMTGVAEPLPEQIESIVEDYSKYPALAGYYVWDEPHTGAFGAVRRMCDILRSLDPERLALNAVIPSYGPYHYPDDYPAHVREFVRVVDPQVLSFDFYSVIKNDDPQNPVRVNTDLYRDLALWSGISRETGKPLWFYPAVCQWGGIAIPSRATLSFQVWSAIAYDVKGIQYFECRGFTGGDIDFLYAPINSDGTKGAMFDTLKQFNSEINALAPVLVKMKLQKVMHTEPVPEDNEKLKAGYEELTDASDNLIISFFKGPESEKYMVVVNKDVNHARDISLTFSGSLRLTQLSSSDDISMKGGKVLFNMEAGGGKLFRLS